MGLTIERNTGIFVTENCLTLTSEMQTLQSSVRNISFRGHFPSGSTKMIFCHMQNKDTFHSKTMQFSTGLSTSPSASNSLKPSIKSCSEHLSTWRRGFWTPTAWKTKWTINTIQQAARRWSKRLRVFQRMDGNETHISTLNCEPF